MTKYDKALLYQANLEIVGTPFSLEETDILKQGCLQFEEEVFEEKKNHHILTTGRDLSNSLKEALVAHNPELKIKTYDNIDGYIVSI